MTNDEKTKKLSPALAAAVQSLYAAFSGYRVPTLCLDVCLNCCMYPEREEEMRRLPLRKISSAHFYEYNNSAKSEVQPEDEIKYFLPRMAELLACDEELHHSSELYLQRLGHCPEGSISPVERTAIDAFALAWFKDRLAVHPWQSGNGFGGEEIFESLLMFDIGGINLQPLLEHWLANDSPASTMHYLSGGFREFWSKQRFENAFASYGPRYEKVFGDWLTDENHRQTFTRRILDLDLSNVAQTRIPSYGACFQPSDVAEAVFDMISY